MNLTFKEYLIEKLTSKIYHGTSSEQAAKSILASKILKNKSSDTVESNFKPLENQTYFTTNLSYAMIYALGGSMFGHNIPERMLKDGEYGYIFLGDNSKIVNHIPDEDLV